jgi:hypothetical protein
MKTYWGSGGIIPRILDLGTRQRWVVSFMPLPLYPQGKLLLYFTMCRLALGPTQSPIQWVPAALSPGVNQPGHKADHSLPSSAEIKNVWTCTSIPPYVFMVCYLVKQRMHLHDVILSSQGQLYLNVLMALYMCAGFQILVSPRSTFKRCDGWTDRHRKIKDFTQNNSKHFQNLKCS